MAENNNIEQTCEKDVQEKVELSVQEGHREVFDEFSDSIGVEDNFTLSECEAKKTESEGYSQDISGDKLKSSERNRQASTVSTDRSYKIIP